MTDRKAQAGSLLSSEISPGLPWIPVSAQMHDHAMVVAGVPARKYYWDAKTFVQTYREVATYYGMDIIAPASDVYNFEIEAMGGKLVYSDNAMPTIDYRDPLIKEPEDLKKLKTPDFYKDGRLPFALDCIKLQKSKTGRFCGIFSMAVGLRSYPLLIRDMRRRPEFVDSLFNFIIDDVLLPFFKAQKDYCGITTAYGADAWACVPNLSVKEMKDWVVPYNQKLARKAEEFGVTAWTGSGDYCEEDLDKFDKDAVYGCFDIQLASRGGNELTLGMGNWHIYPLEPVREYTDKLRQQGINIFIRAGVNARVVRDGPEEKIIAIIKRYISTLARDHELTIWLANIPADTPAQHVHAAVAAAHTYGRKPIVRDLNEVKVAVPQRETFQEWKMKSRAVK